MPKQMIRRFAEARREDKNRCKNHHMLTPVFDMASFHPPRGRKVLVVEDQALIRSCTADFLADAGYTVLEASNSTEALSILLRHPEIALLLTDIEMPGGSDGLTLAEVACWHMPAIKALIVSGRRTLTPDQIPESSRFIAKPYSHQELIETVSMLLR